MKSFLARRWLLSLTTLALALELAVVWQLGRIALRSMAMYSGLLLLVLVLVLTFFNARKKLPFLPLLKVSVWMQAHIYLGLLAFFVYVLHTGARWPDGRLESLLALVFVLVTASGVFGLWLSRWLPPRMTRSGESLVFERIPALRHRLQVEVKEIVRKAETETQSTTLADFYVRILGDYFTRVPALLAPLAGDDLEHRRVNSEFPALRQFLDSREVAYVDQLAELVEAKRNLDCQLAGQRLLKLWLFVHIPLTYGLLVLIAAHVWLALHFAGWL